MVKKTVFTVKQKMCHVYKMICINELQQITRSLDTRHRRNLMKICILSRSLIWFFISFEIIMLSVSYTNCNQLVFKKKCFLEVIWYCKILFDKKREGVCLCEIIQFLFVFIKINKWSIFAYKLPLYTMPNLLKIWQKLL